MADIDLRRAHNLGLAAARAAAEKMAADLGRKFGLAGEWDGNVMHFQRPGVNGRLEVTGKEMRLSVTLGLLLKAMKGSIEKAVEQEVDALFAKVAAPRAKKAPSRPKKGG